MMPPPRNFDAEFVEERMREHRQWQEQEAERLIAQAIAEYEAAKSEQSEQRQASDTSGKRGSIPRCRSIDLGRS
jgi:hypothetical protein